MNVLSLEKIAVEIFPDETDDLSKKVAETIADKVREKNSRGEKTVLGLATGNTPLGVYRNLIRLHKEEGLNFSNVVTFNLDEYYGLEPNHVNSYHEFMCENFFKHINIQEKNIHIPDGTICRVEIEDYCRKYEQEIEDAGDIDIQLLGIGRDGHIGFNEPCSSIHSKTRLVKLDEVTRTDALPDFGERKYVPKESITLGVDTILKAKQIILMATGDHKAEIIRKAVEDHVDNNIVASYLQRHGNTKLFLDRAAASELTRIKTPWVVGKVDWSDSNIRAKAVCYLSERTKKPIHELKSQDFIRNSLTSLIDSYQTPKLTQEIIYNLENKIRNSDKLPTGKRILVLSPHPDDDIISMGGTLRKLVENGNEVYVAYMTPGYTAVFDHDVSKLMTTDRRIDKSFSIKNPRKTIYQGVKSFLAKKRLSKYGMADTKELLELKKAIREGEAIETCEFVGVKWYEFLNLPFYKTGRARKLPVGEEDIEIVKSTIENHNPDLIFAAGDLTDPNGTHRLCLSAIHQALDRYEHNPELWLYTGAWQEFHPSGVDVLVPLTPEEVALKREGIFRHESQKDKAPQPGHGKGEFWQRAEEKNAKTAGLLNTYGIEGYKAMEAFKIHK